MKELRTLGIGLGLLVGIVALTAFLMGPMTWLLTPAEVQQLPPADRLAFESGVRDDLIHLVIAGAIVAGIYCLFAMLSHAQRNR
ncbi:hypothetical protein AB5J62_33665 [Amycolatopsis sp. cg5]|uniref:hypothetical protein n=1 Tax=Amycolatopsis sp. cg5 TaxID=3238802 RepID=UPI00352394F8